MTDYTLIPCSLEVLLFGPCFGGGGTWKPVRWNCVATWWFSQNFAILVRQPQGTNFFLKNKFFGRGGHFL